MFDFTEDYYLSVKPGLSYSCFLGAGNKEREKERENEKERQRERERKRKKKDTRDRHPKMQNQITFQIHISLVLNPAYY